MYTAVITLLILISAFLVVKGFTKNKKYLIVFGISLIIFTSLFFGMLDFWGEMLWFNSLGYGERFWVLILAKYGLAIGMAVLSALVLFSVAKSVPEKKKYTTSLAVIVGIIFGVGWGTQNWDIFLKYINSVSAGISDPILNMDAGFYLFKLPFYESIISYLILLSIASFLLLLSPFIRGEYFKSVELSAKKIEEKSEKKIVTCLYVNTAAFLILLAVDKFLARYFLLYSELGAVDGPGWTDENILLPAYWIAIIITLVFGVLISIPNVRNKVISFWSKWKWDKVKLNLVSIGSMFAALFFTWFVVLTLIPVLFQWLRVEPNEITFEEPYIANNIEFTRYGFNLHKLEEREYPVKREVSSNIIQENENLFENVRLWDWRALDAVYKQFQEIRLYYEFDDVDVDRYHINDDYKQVMVSAREMEVNNLPPQSQTFVNKRFKYTHGYGITLTKVSEFTPQGLPNLLIKDIPPVAEYKSFQIDIPQIYYGELSNDHVIVNSTEEEFDYPKGEENIYIQYPGKGGVQISNLWRKFLFGYKFDGTQLFLSSYPKDSSRIMFHRNVSERVKILAPFLKLDDDPYITLVNGKLYWILDAYTVSQNFPYSESYNSSETIEYKEGKTKRRLVTETGRQFDGINYIRNSVKVVVDAFEGSVDFYIYDENDPIIKVWDSIFAGLFKTKNEMPEGIKKHVRYPADFLLIQGLVYAKYHMNDPTVFYNQEDLWMRATEKYYNNVQPVEPYYIMWQLPESDKTEFVLILPFTPKNRQVMIGWIAGMSDDDNYGRFLAYKFPKEKRILGPQQVETKIDQDRFLSGQLTLWDQRGSNVIRGNVLAIPIEESLFYVEPIYLQAETAAYPELRLVVVMHNDNLSYADTFTEALTGIFDEVKTKITAESDGISGEESPGTINENIINANEAFENYLNLMSKKEYQKAAGELEKLERYLKTLNEISDKNE